MYILNKQTHKEERFRVSFPDQNLREKLSTVQSTCKPFFSIPTLLRGDGGQINHFHLTRQEESVCIYAQHAFDSLRVIHDDQGVQVLGQPIGIWDEKQRKFVAKDPVQFSKSNFRCPDFENSEASAACEASQPKEPPVTVSMTQETFDQVPRQDEEQAAFIAPEFESNAAWDKKVAEMKQTRANSFQGALNSLGPVPFDFLPSSTTPSLVVPKQAMASGDTRVAKSSASSKKRTTKAGKSNQNSTSPASDTRKRKRAEQASSGDKSSKRKKRESRGLNGFASS